MSDYNARNYEIQGGSTWTVSGDLNVPSSGTINIETGGILTVESGGYITVSSGGQFVMPVTSSTSARAPLPNYGVVVVRTSAAATADDIRLVAAPTRAGLVLHINSLCDASGANIGFASDSSSKDVIVYSSSGVAKTFWELVKNSSQMATFVSSNTSEWFCVTQAEGTFSTDASS